MWSNELTIIVAIIIVLIAAFAIVGVNYLLHRNDKNRSGYSFDELGSKRREPPSVVSTGEQYRYESPDNMPFEDKVHASKINPDKHINYGQNYFAYDDAKKKVLVQSNEMPEGLLLDTKDILSYRLIRDGQVMAQGPGAGWPVAGASKESAGSPDGGRKVLCRELKIIIGIRHKIFQEVLMPFISFPIESPYAYGSALEAATEVSGILGQILLQPPARSGAKSMKTSLDA